MCKFFYFFHFSLFIIQSYKNNSHNQPSRFGFTASKKVGGAVVRNKAKRRMRELVYSLKDRFKEFGYDYVLIARKNIVDKKFEDLKKDLKRLKELIQDANKEKAEARLARMHPDFEQIRESDDFHSWAESQPEAIKGWVYGNATNAELASRAIDLFKQDTGKSKSKEVSGDLVAASEMVKVKNSKEIGYGSKKIWTRSQIAAMSQSEFDKNEKAITEAMSEGRVVNDMGNRPSRGSGNPTY